MEKTVMLGKIEGSRKRERIKMRWADSIKEAIGFRAGVLRTGHCGHHSFIHSFIHSRGCQDWTAQNTHSAWHCFRII